VKGFAAEFEVFFFGRVTVSRENPLLMAAVEPIGVLDSSRKRMNWVRSGMTGI